MAAQYKFFVIPVKNIDQAESELNRFLRSARTLTVHREFVNQGENSFWSLSVEYLPHGTSAGEKPDSAAKKIRIDYREVLPPEDFALFVQLREWRKKTAEKEGVPVYTIFTNDQLAAIVSQKINTLAGLGGLEGVGQARLSKYGAGIIQVLQEATAKEETSAS